MLRVSLALALLASAPLAAPARADNDRPPNWWMVYDHDSPDEAELVDLNSFQQSDLGSVIDVMTVYENGKVQRDIRNVNCMEPRIAGDIGAFVCGSARYQAGHGRKVTDTTPSSIVALIPHNGGSAG